ncbi:MAG: hypothetical protein HQ580_05865 [Planctomycetes bacterium]|nr:hypothetical protein [Planctomycetota bacterium]
METIEKITIRCFFIGMAFVLIWFLFCITGDWMYQIHSKLFDVSKEQLALVHYCGLMFTKVCVFLFFLIPYIACKWAGKKSSP